MKRSRNILLLAAYAILFLFTLSVEWIGIHDPGMRAVVNLSTLALVVFGGAICLLLYRKMPSGAGESDKETAAGAAENALKTGEHKEENPNACIVDKDSYLAYAHEKELTRRETEIGFLVVNGYSNQRIAQELYISEATVKKHLTHIYEKTGANGRKALKMAAGGEESRPSSQ